MKNFKAIESLSDDLQPIKDIQHQYRENNLVVELCKTILNLSDDANGFTSNLDKELEQLQDELSDLEGEKEQAECELGELKSEVAVLCDNIFDATSLKEVKKLVEEFQ